MTYFVTGGTGLIGRFQARVGVAVVGDVRMTTRLGVLGEILHAAAPKATGIILNGLPDVPGFGRGAGQEGEAGEGQLTPEQVAFAQTTQGIHW